MADRGGLALACLLVLCAVVSGRWLLAIPFDQAPDEFAHVHYNVRVLLAERRLPVMGVDDTSAYLTPRSNPTGRLVARYSYANTPVPYIGHALTAWVGTRLAGTDPVTGARVFSWLCVLAFVAAVHAAARAAGAPPAASIAGAALVGLVPQVLFLGAYVNQEAFSLAASGVLLWALAVDARRRTPASMACVGLAAGWLPLGRLSFWVLIPYVAAWAAWRMWRAPTLAASAKLGLAAGLSALAVCAVPLARNFWLYGDVTGLDDALRMMREAQGVVIEPRVTVQALSQLVARGFLSMTARSAVMTFDHMNLLVPIPYLYRVVDAVLLAAAVLVFAVLVRARDRCAIYGAALLASLATAALALHAYNAVVFDYQPQGRYLFVVLAPLGVYAAWVGGRHAAVRRVTAMVAAALLVLTWLADQTVADAYRRFNDPTVAAARALALGEPRRIVLDEQVDVSAPGLSGARIELAVEPSYDVAFYGLEVIEPDSGSVIRRAFVHPWEWRHTSSPVFTFRPIVQSLSQVRLRVFTEHPGVHPFLIRRGCGPGDDSVRGPACITLVY